MAEWFWTAVAAVGVIGTVAYWTDGSLVAITIAAFVTALLTARKFGV